MSTKPGDTFPAKLRVTSRLWADLSALFKVHSNGHICHLVIGGLILTALSVACGGSSSTGGGIEPDLDATVEAHVSTTIAAISSPPTNSTSEITSSNSQYSSTCREKIEGAAESLDQRLPIGLPFETAFRQYLSAQPGGSSLGPGDFDRLFPFAEATYLTDPLRPGYEPGSQNPRDWLGQHQILGQPSLTARMREVWELTQQLGPQTDEGFANICSLTGPQIELMLTFLPYGKKGEH